MQHLEYLRSHSGSPATVGLPDHVITRFTEEDPLLCQAIAEARDARDHVNEAWAEELMGTESEFICHLQSGYLNFYPPETVNPYLPLAARGPWVITAYGAVLHDSGGYGMLGFGHAPQALLDAMNKPHVMANIMTPSLSQHELMKRLHAEVGHARADGCPFHQFLCLNSGSESVTLALRIADINARHLTAEGTPRAGQHVKLLALRGAFHGRTDRPAQASHSTMPKYKGHLASFQNRDNLVVIEANDVAALEQAFADAEANGDFLEAVLLEPVMGEGNPGVPVTRDFYDVARRLTKAHGSMMIIDSVQAGLRAQGTVSVVDYPGFEDAEAPDMETYSKALNGGQYPLSVLALNERAAGRYVKGLYGNTMTTNPRALDVACAALDELTPAVRQNIRDRGAELVRKLTALQDEFPGVVLGVTGTGLLCAAELDPERYPVVGFDGVEVWCRRNGLGIIHGGANAIRLTPHFRMTSSEVDLIIERIQASLHAMHARHKASA
jgi:acetylornithine/succinyldiaminopimelate/putrescine aminotransferase